MKTLIFLVLALSFLALDTGAEVPFEPRTETLADGMMPKFYKKRKEPVLNIALVYYGDYYQKADLERVNALLNERFFEATGQTIRLETKIMAILPFKNQLHDFPDYQQRYVTDPVRLQRLWYYDNVGARVLSEVYEEAKKSPELQGDLGKLDALMVVTGAQFDGLGFASGRVGITENPMEIAWGLPDGGSVEFVSDAKVVDELIHELGHVLFLDHASNPCFKQGMTYQETQACCANSASKNDVMSYCRQREKVSNSFFYKFEACHMKTLKEKVVPAMLSGGAWNVADRYKCD